MNGQFPARKAVRGVKTFAECKAALKAAFGSHEAALITFRRGEKSLSIDESPGDERLRAMIQKIMSELTAHLADVERWKKLAATNRVAYSFQLDRLFKGIKLVLDYACGIQSHRPIKDEKRDALILAIKLSKPHWSFGRVAQDYKKRTGKQLSAKLVERIYKRSSERELTAMIYVLRPDFRTEQILTLFDDFVRKHRTRLLGSH